MSVTLSTASERRRRQATTYLPGLRPAVRHREGLLLVAGLLVVGPALYLVSRAVSIPLGPVEAQLARGEIVDLNGDPSAEAIAPRLTVFDDPDERMFAARTLERSLHGQRLPNVGALSRLRVSAAEIASGGRLPALNRRLAAVQEENPKATLIPLLTRSQLVAVKPGFVVRTPGRFRNSLLLWTGLFVAAFLALHLALRWRGFQGDELLLPLTFVLCGLGLVLAVSIRDPLRDMALLRTFVQGVVAGCGFAFAAALVDPERLRRYRFLPLGLALLLSAALVLFGSGPGGSDAKVNLWGFQPVEAVKILVVLFLAAYFFDRWEFLREIEEKRLKGPGWLRLPKLEYLLPPFVALAVVLFFFFLQKDLGPALILSFLFLGLYAVARGRYAMAAVGTGLLALAFLIAYQVGYPRTVTGRIDMWLSPWDNTMRGGEHLAHSLWAMAGGAATGAGLGLGSPGRIPEAHTDMVLAALGEELGWLGLAAILGLYTLLVIRALLAARRAAGPYSFFLGLGLALLLAFQIVLIGGGVVGLFPLSGVVSPFLSSGRSAMLANFAILGLLLAVSSRGGRRETTERFKAPVRFLSFGLAAMGLAIAAKAAWVQLARPDPVLARGVLAVQADGTRRFLYNPRLVEIAEAIPRGSIVDRNGVPLATGNPAELRAHLAAYKRLGVEIGKPDGNRAYPFGGLTFHLVGDLRNRVNWAASNTTFAERDARVRLQGYDDYAAVVEVEQRDGRTTREIQLDYGELVPLLRHRHQPERTEVKELLGRDRTVHLALDVRLQVKVAEILERAARQAGHGAAAVVIDSATGELLASVSYPWPRRLPVSPEDSAALFDRPRYGIYPPGSTFKLVTAMAALRKDPSLTETTFECTGLADGRVGNRVRGWGRPIRDDPTVGAPHGTVDLARGITQSCNAYFAQLGTYKVGPESLLETAEILGIAVARPNTAAQLQDALPQAAYGQGQVIATPLQMARVAAAVAQGGQAPTVRWATDGSDGREAGSVEVVDREAAATISRAMRGVTTVGSARYLAGVQPPLAGKTGTAEVKDKKSHSWFIGYAPYGEGGAKRIAVAVVVEHGGYGGRLAAPAAGEIVRAAAELGLIR